MLNLVICDDEESMRSSVRKHLKNYSAETGNEFNITEFSTGLELIENYPQETDIILLDINMQLMDGLDTAKKIRQFSPDVCIIFITSMTQYALACYKVHAFSFIRKPFTYGELKTELNDAIRQLSRYGSHYIYVQDISAFRHRIDCKDILYVEVQDHDTTFHLVGRSIVTHQKLKVFEDELAGKGFYRCHVSFLVNFRHVARVDSSSVTLNNSENLPIAKQRRKSFLAALTEYAGGVV